MASSNGSFSFQNTIGSRSKFAGDVKELSRLTTTGFFYIRIFPRAYFQYKTEITERAEHFIGIEVGSTTLVSPFSIKFCVDSE